MSSLPPAAAALTAELRCQLRPGRTETFRLGRDEVLIGRAKGVSVCIPAEGVSRRHAKITLRGNAYWIENLSAAGTFVNGHRDRQGRLAGLVVRPKRLRHLDVITLAKSVDLLFLSYDASRPKTPALGIARAALLPIQDDAQPIELPAGDTCVGRSSACNAVLGHAVVSSVHARIERSPRQLVVRDLDSSNGTFLNGERIQTALLRDGDVLSFANVASFRVSIEIGHVDSGEFEAALGEDGGAPPEASAAPAKPRLSTAASHSQAWRTRYEWDTAEMREIAELRAQLDVADARKDAAIRGGQASGQRAPAEKAPKAPPAGPSEARTIKPGALPPAAATPSAASAPASGMPPAPPAQSPRAAPPSLPARPAVAGRVAQVRLTVRGAGADFTLTVTAPGTFELGRASTAALRIPHPTISRRHARIVLPEDRSDAFVEDAGSAHPARLNGSAVVRRSVLGSGDVLEVGAARIEVVVRRE